MRWMNLSMFHNNMFKSFGSSLEISIISSSQPVVCVSLCFPYSLHCFNRLIFQFFFFPRLSLPTRETSLGIATHTLNTSGITQYVLKRIAYSDVSVTLSIYLAKTKPT